MNSKEKLISKLAILSVIIIITAAILFSIGYTSEAENTTYRFSGKVGQPSIDGVLDSLDEAEKVITPKETYTLVITSLGGLADAYSTLITRMSITKLYIITKVHTWAVSAGAVMFILGDERIASSNAKILFHYSRFIMGKHAVTEPMLTNYLKGDRNIPLAAIKTLDKMGRKEVVVYRDILKKANEDLYVLVSTRLGKEVADKVLLLDRDVVLTAYEALELGIVTKVKKVIIKRSKHAFNGSANSSA